MSFFLSFLLFFLLISAFFLFFSLLLPWHLPSGGASQAGGAFRLPWLRSFLFYRTVIKGGTPPTPPRYVRAPSITLRGIGCQVAHLNGIVAPDLSPWARSSPTPWGIRRSVLRTPSLGLGNTPLRGVFPRPRSVVLRPPPSGRLRPNFAGARSSVVFRMSDRGG